MHDMFEKVWYYGLLTNQKHNMHICIMVRFLCSFEAIVNKTWNKNAVKLKITEIKERRKERIVDHQVYATPFIYSCALDSALLAIILVTDKEFRGMKRME